MRTTLSRRVTTLLALPLLLASVSAAVPVTAARAAASANVMWRDVYYSDNTYTTVVGIGHAYSDNDYIMTSGYPTDYFVTYYAPPCD